MMSEQKLIVITGAAGFIGSCMTAYLNEQGIYNLILVDDFSRKDKAGNLLNKKYQLKVHRDQFFDWLEEHAAQVEVIIHLGAKTDTTIPDMPIFRKLNIDYTRRMYEECLAYDIRLIYASSAATYGNGELGYRDDESLLDDLRPLNAYAVSKNEIDKFIFGHKTAPPQVAALKFFNVYGPNEYHKGRMASVVLHAYRQLLEKGEITLFRSHNKNFGDGEQQRDFIYVKDVVKVIYYLVLHPEISGIYNLGTGQARSFKDLANALLDALQQKHTKISYIDTPENIRANYQYFTEAQMDKLSGTGYAVPFMSLEEGIADYVHAYLEKAAYW